MSLVLNEIKGAICDGQIWRYNMENIQAPWIGRGPDDDEYDYEKAMEYAEMQRDYEADLEAERQIEEYEKEKSQ